MKNYCTIGRYSTIVCITVILIGCASEPATISAPPTLLSGEEMLRESQGIANLGDRWKKGKQLVDRGNVLVQEGQNKMDEGKRMIADGEKVMRESEENYKNIKQ
ncbi:MAG: hypothetical protein HOP23_03700 [Methylococcaceae bacterium]|nr:hypothetical protein [Methylococcaceae bacterium]